MILKGINEFCLIQKLSGYFFQKAGLNDIKISFITNEFPQNLRYYLFKKKS